MKTNPHISRLVILSGLLGANIALAQTTLPETEPVNPILLEEQDAPPLPEDNIPGAESIKSAEPISGLPEALPIDFSDYPPVIEEEPGIAGPEPTFEDLLTPAIQAPVELKALNAEIKARKGKLKLMENKLERINVRQELIAARQEKIALRKAKLDAEQAKLDLKREDIESQLSEPDLTPNKRERLKAKLERIIEREARIDEKLAGLDERSQKLDDKLERLQQRLVDLGEQPPEEIDPDAQASS